MCEPARVTETQARHEPLFRALKNGDGQPLRYLAIQARWASFYREPLLVFPVPFLPGAPLHRARLAHSYGLGSAIVLLRP